MRPVRIIFTVAILALIGLANAATVNVIAPAPTVMATLLNISKYGTWTVQGGTVTLKLNGTALHYDLYQGKTFTPGATIVLVDTGVKYDSTHFLCNMQGAATASLVNYLINNGYCKSSGNVTLADLASVPVTYTIVGSTNTYTIPSSTETYTYCITDTTILNNAGFNVSNLGNTSLPDTVIILQPTSWKSDLVGHGTMVASALCGAFDNTTAVSNLGKDLFLKIYTGTAIGANVFVVDIETIAIILPDYVPQITSGITPQSLIASAEASGAVSTFYLDYEFRYLGPVLAEKAVIQALTDAQTSINSFVTTNNAKKPIVLIEPVVFVNQTGLQTYCNDLETVLSGINALAAVAPLGNGGKDVQTELNANGEYLWPAQCNDAITNPTVPVYPVSGVILGLNATKNTNNITINAALSVISTEFNYDEVPTNLWFVMPAKIDSTYNYFNVSNYDTTSSGTQFNLILKFTGIPVIMAAGSIESPSGTYGEVAIPTISVNYDSTTTPPTLTVTVGGTKGTSLAAAYFASALALLSLDPTASTPQQVYSHLDAMTVYKNSTLGYTVDGPFGTYSYPSFGAVWYAAIKPDTGLPFSAFPFDLNSNSNSQTLYPNQLPASGTTGTSLTTPTTTTTPSSSSGSQLVTTTLKPFQAQIPAPALLAPILAYLRKKIKKK